ncbi:protein THALLO [Rutidosis leptorrhynchoides]|uniref:protein THALLO n=1 Tax=Rutidosis leptorrhynchoides TaxID=125765 RepID=UPI003A99CCCB
MAKGSNGRFSNKKTPPQKSQLDFSDSDMDDEIDVFHKQRDIVPLDFDNDIGDSDEDNDQHVFEIEDGSDDDDDDDEDEDEDEDDDSEDDTGLAAKIKKQQKSLKAKVGGAADETQDDAEEEEHKSVAWGPTKSLYYDNNQDESSEDEEEVLRLQKEKLKLYSNEDHGLDDDNEDDSEEEPTFENLSKGKARSKANLQDHDVQNDIEVVMKDPNALSKEEQMDIVYHSAPELVGLLSELNEAVEQLETKVDPVLSKLKEEKMLNTSGIHYMELKKQLLLSYTQAITFHLLLKSEGHPVRDHPVLARLVEIKNMLDQMKSLDENHLCFDVEDFLKKRPKTTTTTMVDSPSPKNEIAAAAAAIDPISLKNNSQTTTTGTQIDPNKEGSTLQVTLDHGNGGKRKRGQSEKLGLQSVEMLKVRAALEEKLKQKGVFNLDAPKTNGGLMKKNMKPLNGKLEALDDYDDDAFDIENNNKSNMMSSNRLSQLVTQKKKPKVISGDDDLPQRDDIGERRRKHEMRVLASAGIQSADDNDNDLIEENVRATVESDGDSDKNEDDETDNSDSDVYKKTKKKRDAKLAVKAQMYSRSAPSVITVPETLEGKRHINHEMEKNRGLTRKRNKETKNPRKKYKLKHKKKEVARKGQVREHKKPDRVYGGEGSGITTISRSTRFKS